MKAINRTAKKKIIVALLGMCVVASSYSTAPAMPSQASAMTASVQPLSQASATSTTLQPTTGSPQDLVWFWPYWPYYYYYTYYGYYYFYPYYYYYNGGVVVF